MPPTPLLDRSDLAATAFLLAAEGKDPAYAPRALRCANIDYARSGAIRRSRKGVRSWENVRSLDRATPRDDGTAFQGTVAGPDRDPAEVAGEHDTMARVLGALPLPERRILAALLRGDRAKTMVPRLGLSEGRVSQLLKMARARAAAILSQ